MSFPAYPEYRDSGVPWLGAVPRHWRADRISRLFGVIGSGTTPSAPAAFESGTINWVTTGELREQPIFVTMKQVTDTAVAELSALQVYPKGTLLIAMYGATIGRLGWLEIPACVNQACCAMAEPTDLVPRFAFHCLSVATEALILLSSGGGQPNINQEKVRAFRLPVPPLGEQRAIAAFLDRETAKIDALVAEQERLIALLKEKRAAVISHAVTKGLNPHAPTKDTGIEWLGKIPAHWEVVPMKHLVTFRNGGTPSKDNLDFWNGEIPWASAKDLKADVLTDTIDHLTQHAVDERAAMLVPAGAVAVLVRGMMLARFFPVCELGVPMTINQDLKALLPSVRLDGSFLAWALRGTSAETLNRLDEAGHGTKALRMEAWTSMALPLPPLDEQADIVARIRTLTEAIDQLAVEAQNAITLLQERRAALISAAVTGKIDVRALVNPPATAELETA